MAHCNCVYYVLIIWLVMSTIQAGQETHLSMATRRTTADMFHLDTTYRRSSTELSTRCTEHNETTKLCTKCLKGYFGETTCSRACNANCSLGYCNIITGACKYGCRNASAYSSTSPWYGRNCSMRCNDNCILSRCFRNGTCYLGCKNGTYGDMCDITCPSNCKGGCSMKGGCLGDCKEGFYGPYCNVSCSDNCNGSVCHSNGTCYSCKSGYRGDMCEDECTEHCVTCHQFGNNCTSCVTGRYGTQCNATCHHCNGSCEFRDGQCSSGCRPDYYGSHCDKHCGSNCQSGRSTNVPQCHQSTGHCGYGCTRGWYGQSCELSCSSGCESLSCNRSTGNCSLACNGGYWGNYCNRTCPPNCAECNRTHGKCFSCASNTYGSQCENLCDDNCRDNSCNMSGTCTSGCVSGYYGDTCGTKCHGHCSTCDRYNGTCITCSPGWTGVNCKDSAKIVVVYALVVLLLLSACCIVLSLVYLYIKRYYKGSVGYFRTGHRAWFRRPFTRRSLDCPSLNRHTWRPSPHAYISRKSKRLTLLDEENNVLPQWSREEMSAFRMSNKRRSQVSKLDRYSFDNNILFNNNERFSNKRYSESQCRRPEDHQFQYDGSLHVCIEVGSELSEYTYGGEVSTVSLRNQEDQCEMCPKGKMSKHDRQAVHEDEVKLDPTTSLDTSMNAPHRAVHLRTSACLDKTGDNYAESSEGSFEGFNPPMSPCTGHVAVDTSVRLTPVDCKYFNNYVMLMKRQGGFDTQFKNLPQGELAVCTEAKRPENETKNRFANIHPYDHSRVVLNTGVGGDRSDYINASYINGYGRPKFFIAAQGPFSDNTGSFLTMVYQFKVTAIVMLTKLFENNRLKCGKYWPDVGSSRQYGDCLVHNVQEEMKPGYCVRTVTIKQEGGEQHTLSQYHYTSWPDHGQPDDPRSLLDFYRDVKTSAFGEGPVVVHCSAGIGRTGTFLALDYLLDQASAEDIVDVYECVKRLRYQRMNMVQNKVQYTFLHDLVALALAEHDWTRT